MKIIETNNLRIGNIINCNDGLFKVMEIYKDSIFVIDIYDKNDSGTILKDEIKGVKITEKVLNRFGWHKNEENNFKLEKSKAPISHIDNHLDIECPYDENSIRVFLSLEDGNGTAVYLNYLHELQNLFQALHFKEIIYSKDF